MGTARAPERHLDPFGEARKRWGCERAEGDVVGGIAPKRGEFG